MTEQAILVDVDEETCSLAALSKAKILGLPPTTDVCPFKQC